MRLFCFGSIFLIEVQLMSSKQFYYELRSHFSNYLLFVDG